MGLKITCSDKEISMGQIGFFNLRCNICEMIDPAFRLIYSNYIKQSLLRSESLKFYEKSYENYIASHNVSKEIDKFLFESDCCGKCTPLQAQEILKFKGKATEELLNKHIGYEAGTETFSDFLKMLELCSESEKNIEWS